MIFGYDLIVIRDCHSPKHNRKNPLSGMGFFFSGRAPRPYKVLF